MGPGLSCKWSPWARRDVPGPSWAVWCSCSLLLKAVPQVLSPLVCFVSPATSLTKASSALWLLWVFPFCVFSQQVPRPCSHLWSSEVRLLMIKQPQLWSQFLFYQQNLVWLRIREAAVILPVCQGWLSCCFQYLESGVKFGDARKPMCIHFLN